MKDSGISSLYGGVDMTKVMFGQNAIQIPFNMFFNHLGKHRDSPNKHAGVFQFEHPTTQFADFAGNRHQLVIVGDAIIRPRIVIATDQCLGHGIAGIYRDGFLAVAENMLDTEKNDIVLGMPDDIGYKHSG